MVKLPYLPSIANVSLVSFFHIIAQGIKCNKKTHVCMYLFRVANVVKLPYGQIPYLHSIANVSQVSFFHIIAQGIKCNQKIMFACICSG